MKRDALRGGLADVIGFEDEVGEVPGSKVHGMKHNICKSVVNDAIWGDCSEWVSHVLAV